LYPFAHELPADTDWIDFIRTRDPAGDMRRLSDEWTEADKRNGALERSVPLRFLRSAVIGDANRDMAVAAEQKVAISMDPLHAQVPAQRFNDDRGWAMSGFAVPILFPEVGGWPWEAVVKLRRDPNMARFRAILREVEQEAAAEAAAKLLGLTRERSSRCSRSSALRSGPRGSASTSTAPSPSPTRPCSASAARS